MNKKLLFILIFSLAYFLRVISGYFYLSPGDTKYWEYGSLAQNMNAGKGYSLYYPDGDTISLRFSEASDPRPSAYMPPAYPVYLMPFFKINDPEIRDLTFIFINSLISLIPLFLLFRLTSRLFSQSEGYWAVIIYSIMPEFVVADISVGPTLFYHIGCLIIFWFFTAQERFSARNILLLILANTFMIYLRSEFILFTLFQFAFIYKSDKKFSIIFLGLTILLLLPWQLRNLVVFEKFIPMTTSSGLNLYRGNNPIRPGIWADDSIAAELLQFRSDRNYELHANDLYISRALHYISQNPGTTTINSLEKIIHLWGIYYYDARTFSPLYLMPWLLLLTFSVFGLFRLKDKTNIRILLWFLLYHTIWAAVFFALIRYQTMMKIALIPIAAFGINQLIESLIKKKV
jgi:hypothetical protein